MQVIVHKSSCYLLYSCKDLSLHSAKWSLQRETNCCIERLLEMAQVR